MKLIIYGFITTLSIIMPIGAQSSFVIKQGLKKNHVFLVATICGFFDFIFMSLGIFGIGSFLSQNKILLILITFAGIIFLLYYAYINFKSAFSYKNVQINEDGKLSFKAALFSIVLITILNPHLYLDAFVLLGAIASNLTYNEKIYFTIGAVSSSFFWFYLLGFGARILLPLFKNPLAWKVLDFIIACIMLLITFMLINFILKQI